MKKGLKITVTVLLILLVIGAAIGGYFIYRHNTMYISKQEAVICALNDAGLSSQQVADIDVDFENNKYSDAFYEVDFKSDGVKYEYLISATTGDVLSVKTK